jgi:hypothetical protein
MFYTGAVSQANQQLMQYLMGTSAMPQNDVMMMTTRRACLFMFETFLKYCQIRVKKLYSKSNVCSLAFETSIENFGSIETILKN